MPELSLTLTELALAGLALFLAGLVKGVLGIGTPLVGVPALTLLIDPASAAASIAVPSLLANVVQLRDGQPIPVTLRRFWPLIITLMVGIPVGVWWLAEGHAGSVLGVIAVLVLAFVTMRLARPSLALPVGLERPVGVFVGLVGGAVGGMSMIFGPFVITYLMSLRLSKNDFVGTIALLYLLSSAVVVGAFVATGLMTPERTALSFAAVVPVLAGVGIGRRVRNVVSQALFERLLLIVLVVMALTLLRRAAG